ncbi:hypothetical protein SAMD00019534_028750, partial [Acytostelium subglobosum LB1]|uniref:hypothetical protein n=1 Tax=Acytostelium subglobosum LB1 TaxID=1410327 RepID=UPI000644FB71
RIIIFACIFAVGILMNILACVFSSSGWPIIVVATYFLAPLPNIIFKNRDDFSSEHGSASDLGMFLTGFLVVAGFAVPGILAHNYVITYKALAFAISGGIVVIGSLVAFMAYFQKKDSEYDM